MSKETIPRIDFEKLRQDRARLPKDNSVITVRLSAELHQSLKDLAHHEKVSLNQLCVAALAMELSLSELTVMPESA